MDFDTQWCCDNHLGTNFQLSSFFLGNMGNNSDEPDREITTVSRKRKRAEYRALED
jgi:hypothetical protein